MGHICKEIALGLVCDIGSLFLLLNLFQCIRKFDIIGGLDHEQHGHCRKRKIVKHKQRLLEKAHLQHKTHDNDSHKQPDRHKLAFFHIFSIGKKQEDRQTDHQDL